MIGAMGTATGANYTVYGADIPDPDPCLTPGVCASNVLFLPGIEGSRLYEGTGCGKSSEEKLWEPLADTLIDILLGAGNDKMRDLFLNASGQSLCSDIYVKEGGVIDTVRGDNIYQTFINEMNGLKTGGDINDWKAVAYDWRLSLDDLVNKGTARDGNVYYSEASSTPYIEQTLRSLARSSKTGKVSIVAHSNGGLVAKKLLDKLGSGTSASLVDKLIMVGVPQSGAPEALGAALVGHNAGIYKYGFPIVSNDVAREFAQNAPMVYHLFPSANYFSSVSSDIDHPVIRFSGAGYNTESTAYGATIDNIAERDNFLLATDGGRTDPVASNLSIPEILSSLLIDYSNTTHVALDAWIPPNGITVSQITGWGADTIAGIDFFTPVLADALTAIDAPRAYRPIFTEDGDGTVPIPSALMIASSTSVKKYWVDLDSYFRDTSIERNHKDLFEIPSLETFIKNIIKNSTSTLPTYISTSQPSPTGRNKLTFLLHSPLTLQFTDGSGNITGIGADNSMTQNIPDSSYGEFGEVKYITVPTGNYTLTMRGQDTGKFMLEMQELSGNSLTTWSTLASVPATSQTLASLTISGGLSTVSPLLVDTNGDGSSVITLTPILGEYVNYVAPVQDPTTIILSRSTTVSTGPTVPMIEATTTVSAEEEEFTNATTSAVTQHAVTNSIESPQASTKILEVTEKPKVEKKLSEPIVVETKKEVIEPDAVEEPQKGNVTPQTASAYDSSNNPLSNILLVIAYVTLIIIGLWYVWKKYFHSRKNET
jgi:pimeloyl-ACP methyl ester carboxylesterase